MKIEPITPQRADVKCMIARADELMLMQYPAESNHLDDVSELSKPNVYFVGAFVAGQLAGIGAVKLQANDGKYGEVKRVYVDSAFRGRKLATSIMDELEAHLVSKGISIARLETGDKQVEAIGLYQKLGYQVRTPYGKYTEDPLSVFMEKILILSSNCP